MRSQNVPRDYKMNDSEMCFLASKICSYLTRDLSDLQDFGITALKISTLKALISDFQNFPDDDYYLGDSMEATELKNQKAVELKEDYRKMILRINMVWGENPGKLRKVSASEYYSAPLDQLLTMARKTYIFAKENLTELATAGLTQALLDKFKQLTDDLEAAMAAQDEAIDIRDSKATERGTMGNEIYKTISMYCEIGKKLYAKSNPSKYNDYIIYSPSAGGLKPPTGLKYLLEHNTAVWDVVENATSYELQYSPDEKTWSEAYGGADNMVHYFPPQEGWAYFRCRARNANGYGEYSEVLKTGYYQILPPPNNIHAKIEANTDNGLILIWDEVPSATNYLIYTSIVPLGKPEETFKLLDKTTATKFTAELEQGMRHYFQIASENSAQTSLNSSSVHLDVNSPLPS